MLSESNFKRQVLLWKEAGLTEAQAASTDSDTIISNIDAIVDWINSNESGLNDILVAERAQGAASSSYPASTLKISPVGIDAGVGYRNFSGTNTYLGFYIGSTLSNMMSYGSTSSTSISSISNVMLVVIRSKHGYIYGLTTASNVTQWVRSVVFYAQDDTGEKQKVFVSFPSGQYLMSIRTEAEGFTGITALSSRGLSSQCVLTKFAVPNTDLITTGGYVCDGVYVPATKFYEVNGETFCNVAAAYGSTANLALLIEEE
jgi:hypothetical protein